MAPCVWGQAGGGAAGSGGSRGSKMLSLGKRTGREKCALRGPGERLSFLLRAPGVSHKTPRRPTEKVGCAFPDPAVSTPR